MKYPLPWKKTIQQKRKEAPSTSSDLKRTKLFSTRETFNSSALPTEVEAVHDIGARGVSVSTRQPLEFAPTAPEIPSPETGVL